MWGGGSGVTAPGSDHRGHALRGHRVLSSERQAAAGGSAEEQVRACVCVCVRDALCRFTQPEGDHLTLLAVYKAWERAQFSNPWCHDNFIQSRSMRRGQDIRKQLMGIMDRYRMDIVSCGSDSYLIRQAITSGFFKHAAKRDPTEGYKTLADGGCGGAGACVGDGADQRVYIHPSSALFMKSAEYVIYHELVLTSKEYMRNCMVLGGSRERGRTHTPTGQTPSGSRSSRPTSTRRQTRPSSASASGACPASPARPGHPPQQGDHRASLRPLRGAGVMAA